MVRVTELLSLCIISWVLVIAQEGRHFEIYDFGNAGLYIDGIATIEDGILKLTNNSHGATGHAFQTAPINFRDGSFSFSTEFVFAIVPEQPNSYGQGMAFVMSPTPDLRYGAEASYLGIFNKTNDNRTDNSILAVELDTHVNPEASDTSENHIGIDVNSIVSIEHANASYFDEKAKMNRSLVLASKQSIHVWIEYNGDQRLLNVTLAPLKTLKPSLPLLSRLIDLSKIFKKKMYLGFSGSTSGIASSQYILGWAFTTGRKAQSLDITKVRVLDLPQPPPSSSPGLDDGEVILISTISAILVVVMILGGTVYCYRRKNYSERFQQWEQEYCPQRFTFKTLCKATKGFKKNRVIGGGGFGKVYRGELPDGIQIAVKRVSKGSEQGMREYASEVSTMGRLGHRNVVQLLGYCRKKREYFLVYEHLVNGSVSDYLSHGKILLWSQRVHIVKGVASAINYLHECLDKVVLHRDIKGSNVLLDANLNGKIGDFGLARSHERGMALQFTRVVGTVGYMAPEISIPEGVASTQTDVYAFGAFLLEVICGRRPVEHNRPNEQIMLSQWVANCGTRGCIIETVDCRLSGNFGVEEAKLFLKLGMLCLQKRPEDRPSMRDILDYMQGNASAPDIPFDDAADLW